MKSYKKVVLLMFSILSTATYSQEVYSKEGLSLSIDSVMRVGESITNYKNGNFENFTNGLYEDTAFFQAGFKKKFDKIEAGGHLRYGAGWEANKDRTGGDMYLKYNFNDNISVEYAKSDFKYVDYTNYGAVVGKNLGTGTQLDINPENMVVDPVLNNIEVDYGVAFLALGTNGVGYSRGGFTPDGAIWNPYIAYKENNLSNGLTPGSLNFYYNKEKFNLKSSFVYEERNCDNFVYDSDNNYSENIKAKDKGFTVKGDYEISSKSKFGGGVSYGNGDSDSSVDSRDISTTIMGQNLWYKTNVKGYDFMAEIAHATFEVDSSYNEYQDYLEYLSTGDNSSLAENSVENRYGADKELTGLYAKVSKFTKYGIPAIDLKVAQSVFDEAKGFTYETSQKNTLIEIRPGFTILSHKIPGLIYEVSGNIGKYKSENIDGTKGKNNSTSQLGVSTYITYVF